MGALLADPVLVTVARDMASLGARAPTIRSLTGFSEKEAAEIYQDVWNRPSPRGRFPHDHLKFCNPLIPALNIQASLLANFMYQVRASASDACVKVMEARIMVTAFRQYLRHCEAIGEEAKIDFDNARLLQSCLASRSLAMMPCRKCGGSFVVQNGAQVSLVCPCCRNLYSIRNPKANRRARICGAVAPGADSHDS